MGDTGSLALGGSLGAVGIITKHEIVLAITGGSICIGSCICYRSGIVI